MKKVINETEVNDTAAAVYELLKTNDLADFRDKLQAVTNHYLADDRIGELQRLDTSKSLNLLNQTLLEIDCLASELAG